ncbi:hypothetical protein LTR70_006592 [Exophiala xenobiotica]|uniref:Major facilitator superfamily (MFS) profile domain-containing protein n=1 Tax=Lithohypha guttulata TaxID=1690604 RepID=A0ABR0K7Y8_9EURO|nr:hypothetical protein LTR24_005911 [Lithohypha guttulata]KAK5315850.1 hypothetical protein LTR70_006592 [Exophiala xenobiotica]
MSTVAITTANTYELPDAIRKDYTPYNARRLSRDAYSRSSGDEPVVNPRGNQTVPAQRPASISGTLSAATATASDIETPSSMKVARANLIIFHVSLVILLASVSSGIVVVGLPRIASDLQLVERLYLWPTSVYGLTAGAMLLPAGVIADVIGPRSVELVAVALLGIFTLGCGWTSTGIQLVMFRALQGVATAMHMPCSVSLVTRHVPNGKRRNIGFACLGLSMPLGFSIGLVLGGVLVDTIGWRVGFYIAGAIVLLQAIASLRIIPADVRPENVMSKLKAEIDWIGAAISCVGLAMFSYVLAILSTDSDNMRQPSAIAMLTISIVLLVMFPFWMWHQEKKGRPALVPNYLWKNKAFSCICALTVLTWGVMNSMELFASLYFQEVQEFSALQASLRILPSLIVGAILNLTTGLFVDHVPVFWLAFVSTTLTAVAPLLMALINPHWTYWRGAFVAQILSPLSGDVLFTVGLIVVSESFTEDTQALAGAVFNTVAYFGLSLGLNSMQVVSLLVTKGTQYRDKSSPAALLQGYQASFWAMFAMTVFCSLLCVVGLRNVGKVGLKRE